MAFTAFRVSHTTFGKGLPGSGYLCFFSWAQAPGMTVLPLPWNLQDLQVGTLSQWTQELGRLITL